MSQADRAADWYWYSRREILVGKGFLNVNCPTFDDWAIIFQVPVTTI